MPSILRYTCSHLESILRILREYFLELFHEISLRFSVEDIFIKVLNNIFLEDIFINGIIYNSFLNFTINPNPEIASEIISKHNLKKKCQFHNYSSCHSVLTTGENVIKRLRKKTALQNIFVKKKKQGTIKQKQNYIIKTNN